MQFQLGVYAGNEYPVINRQNSNFNPGMHYIIPHAIWKHLACCCLSSDKQWTGCTHIRRDYFTEDGLSLTIDPVYTKQPWVL